MYEDMNRQLQETQQGAFRLQKIDVMLVELGRQKSTLVKKVSELKTLLEKEDVDVAKLEGKGLSHLFHTVLGNLEERILKESQEALAARLKYDEAVSELEQLEFETNKLKSERSNYVDCEQAYLKLYQQKKELLMQSHSETANQIMELTERIQRLLNHRNEIREAISAGSQVTRHLNNAIKSLDSAKGWGTWDMLGGGLISDLAKHSHIDEAKGEAERTQMALLRFKTELADVRIMEELHIDTEGFAKFADFFFDGLIADWCMQTRITNSKANLEKVNNKVNMVLFKLYDMEKAEAAKVEELENEIKELIEREQ